MRLDCERHRLFVEGPSDAAVVNQLVLRRLQLNLSQPDTVQIVKTSGDGGFDWVRKQTEAALINQKLERVGAVIDRDALDGKRDNWDSMRSLLEQHLDAVATPSTTGLVTPTRWGGRFGLWMMPDNITPGDLETFLEGLVPTAAQDWALAVETATAAKAVGAAYQDVHARKAQFHTWLAWRDPPGIPYGTAIRAQQLGERSAAADGFVDWFQRLFLDP